MPEPAASASGRRYRARTGDRAFDVVVAGDATVTLDGRAVDVTFDRTGEGTYALRLDGRSLPATVEPLADGRLRVTVAGQTVEVVVQDERDLLMERYGGAAGAGAGVREVRAPMPGLVLSVGVAPGETVARGAGLVVLEAMKMENELRADADGVVRTVHVAPGDAVVKNALLVEFEA